MTTSDPEPKPSAPPPAAAPRKHKRSILACLFRHGSATTTASPPPPPPHPSSHELVATNGLSITQDQRAALRDPHAEDFSANALAGYNRAKDAVESADMVFDVIAGSKLVSEFLAGLAKTVPVAGPLLACFNTLIEFEQKAQANIAAMSDLREHAVFTLSVMRTANETGQWTRVADLAEMVLASLLSVIKRCAVLFTEYDTMSWLKRRIYAADVLQKIKDHDQALKDTLARLALLLSVNVNVNVTRPWHPIDAAAALSPEDRLAADEIAKHGGVDKLVKNPAAAKLVAQRLAAAVGETFRDEVLADLRTSFATSYVRLEQGFDAILAKVNAQGKSIDEVKAMLAALTERGSMFSLISCTAVRSVWLRAGWGARVKVRDFADVLVDHLRDELDVVVSTETLGRRATADLNRRIGHFSAFLQGLD
ncbi:hypothetical protein H9P43_004809 [Blastocladiella emersonii ATCC 22665]|nr:hypothetical protein H9P43_004809 [Blastocladiella emersonii ATCC 22665]